MDRLVEKAEDYDLSGADIHRITDGLTRIIEYEYLENVSTLEEILEQYGAVVILYTTKKNFGHWVALFRTDNNNPLKLEFFDPYGLKVDEELNISNELHLRLHGGVIVPHLTSLLMKGGYMVRSNTQRLQKVLEHTNTCGRWVALRIRFRNLRLKDFIRSMTKNKHYDGDFWVSALTLLV